ncbi:MAG TPA: TraB/GumN family protein [Puia sp.]|jgi:uncharacterized protein YbaP (TraB family)|nr:TraB/GumN family protein [Puia sp.]
MRWIFMRMQLATVILFFLPVIILAQKKEQKKYPSLLWQITGNGLTKPSYLFGTMHVSSKMVFNLGDSFYAGIKSSDVVALELDPQLWQDQMARFQKMQSNLHFYSQGAPNDYLNEKSFQIEKYEEKLKAALSEEPTIINGLLYRTFQPKADFEEDTYLDLYIYQIGKKLGKQATGVENYFETEKLILEATQDMMKDKKRRNPDGDGESMYEIEKKTEDAYRQGDLDLLDSLERLMQSSDAFMEKFLYKRNEIQARSIDSILKKHSLFVGVGAAHLPGKRGVIELLRTKGYKLRPISIQFRDASQRDEIDKVKVRVSFSSFSSDDGSFAVELPGKLYKRADSHYNDSWQYADMSNGSYYMVTRVKTYNHFVGQDQETVFKNVDSLLYENIPGKILKKTIISKNGFKGYDITNKTRRGDMQRYNIIITPFEVLVFKISGNGNYVDGEEAGNFFNSIEIKKRDVNSWTNFEPQQGGFRVRLPGTPFETKNTNAFDGVARWEYEANDTSNGDAYLILKKSIQNFRYLEDDLFNLNMMEESFRLSEYIDKPINTKYGMYRGRQSLDASYRLKDGSYIKAKFLIKGPNYYLLGAHSKTNKSFSDFFDSFSFAPFRYGGFKNYADTFINVQVYTPVVPEVDVNVRDIFEKSTSEDFLNSVSDNNNYWPKNKTALFQDDSTGEAVYISVEPFPKYYYPKDSATFWKDEMNEKHINQDMVLHSKKPFRFSDSAFGYKYVFSDTGSSRLVSNWAFVQYNRLYRVVSLCDSAEQSDFVNRFYESVRPLAKKAGLSVFENKLDIFFHDFYSKDSAENKRAKDAISNIYFGASGLHGLLQAVQALPYNDKDYFTTKTKLINELGYINDSTVLQEVVEGLKTIYEEASDTGTFQNAVLKALAKNKTKESYQLLKNLLLQDPPVFDNPSDYNYLFQDIGDSLLLARSLFPELLQLSTVDDYKDNVHSLLTTLVDSGYMKAEDYSSYFNKIYFEAKIQLKRQLARDELQGEKKNDDDNDGYGIAAETSEDTKDLEDYAVLLIPFYDSNANVPKFFDKLLQSKDVSVRLSTVVLLLRNNKTCPDSILQFLAKDDKYRFSLYKSLETMHLENKFPEQYRNQQDIARSALVSPRSTKPFFAVEYVDKRWAQCKQKKGWVYFFKYKNKRQEESWQMAISGLQPANLKIVSSDNDLVALTNKKIKKDKPVLEQFDEQLKRLLFSKHKSAVSFYLDNGFFVKENNEEN